MLDRRRSDRLARALAEELAHTADQEILDAVAKLRESPPWGAFNTTALIHNDHWRDVVSRALELADLAE
jgi:hypothetical protein